jgi:mRNA interferase MazF
MENDFDRWNDKKKQLNADIEPLYFRDGDIWWAHLGVNIGYEIDGKQVNFARPVIMLRKYNKYSFLALPLTTRDSSRPYKLPVGDVAGKQAFAVVSQLRNIDSRRLYQKIRWLPPEVLLGIRKETFRINNLGLENN